MPVPRIENVYGSSSSSSDRMVTVAVFVPPVAGLKRIENAFTPELATVPELVRSAVI